MPERPPAADAGTPAPGSGRALLVLSVACFFSMSAWFSASAVLPALVVAWGLAPGDGALLTMAVQLGFVAGALVSAVLTLADVVGPRRLILAGALAAAAANLSLAWVDSLRPALGLRFATGACLALVYPPFVKVMSTWFREGRGRALGIMLGSLTLGSAIPHLFKWLGGADWRVVIMTTSALTASGGLIAAFIGRDGPFPFQKAVFDPHQTYRVTHNQGWRLAAYGYFGHMWELYAMWAWFPLCVRAVFAEHGLGEADAALAAFLIVASGFLGCWLGGVLGDRWGRTRLTSLALVCSGASAVLVGAAATRGWPLWAFLALGTSWGFWVNADSAQFTTIVSEVADQSYVGTATTMQLAAGFLLTNVTLWLTPRLEAEGGWVAGFAVLAIGPAWGVAAMQRLRRTGFAARIAGGRG